MSPRLAFALDAATRAGRLTLAQFQSGVEVEPKEDGTPVTAADRAAERLIRQMIGAAYPGESIVGEEEGGSLESADRWVIDPIDGTKSFIAGVPLYGTLLSFERDRVAEVGVCYLPALDELVFAERGEGARWNGRPCRVSQTSELVHATLCCGGHASMRRYGRLGPFLELSERCRATRTWSDAYGHALVATGRVEAMVDPVVRPWDISAMSLIVREAGGKFTDFSGGGDPTTDALASNGLLHETLLEAFRN